MSGSLATDIQGSEEEEGNLCTGFSTPQAGRPHSPCVSTSVRGLLAHSLPGGPQEHLGRQGHGTGQSRSFPQGGLSTQQAWKTGFPGIAFTPSHSQPGASPQCLVVLPLLWVLGTEEDLRVSRLEWVRGILPLHYLHQTFGDAAMRI